MPGIALLLGAGFNADAAVVAGVDGEKYPLAPDLAEWCFGRTDSQAVADIENLFATAITERDRGPLERLATVLFRADNYVGGALCDQLDVPSNVYARFSRDFSNDPILTFNYDSLPELLSFSLGLWRPDDGFGIHVIAEAREVINPPPVPSRSARPILHLHGALTVYSVDFFIEHNRDSIDMLHLKHKSDFIFDPYSIARRFFPFEHQMSAPAYEFPYNRIIAPIPDKAEGLRRAFVKEVHALAVDAIHEADSLIAIGYRFNEADRASFDRLVRAARGKPIVIVSPEAEDIAKRLETMYETVRLEPLPLTFADWVVAGYPGARA